MMNKENNHDYPKFKSTIMHVPLINTTCSKITFYICRQERVKREKKDREKQKKKDKVERQKAEGKYLTPKQRDAQRRNQQMLEMMKAQGNGCALM